MVVIVVHRLVHVCFSRFHRAKDEQWSEVESEPVMCNRQRYAKQAGYREIVLGREVTMEAC